MRLIVFNDSSFEELLNFRLSLYNIIVFVTALSLCLIILTAVIIIYTPIKEYIPGYPQKELTLKARKNQRIIDSLIEVSYHYNLYLNNLKQLLSNGEPLNMEVIRKIDTTKSYKNINLNPSFNDSLFRKKYEEENLFSVSLKSELSNIILQNNFTPPVKGIISRKFNLTEKHYGIDIVTKFNEPILSISAGTVIFAGYNILTGNTVIIQHQHEIISIYKHLETIVVEEGDKVEAGSAIGIVGGTGKESTGQHLHFELWYKSRPIDPEEFISF
ncbi:MAG: M23 family metallopeptidase [Bacteroidales bacterium]|nr:M23 family metallopeptidase [Bacteroidales bacterium]